MATKKKNPGGRPTKYRPEFCDEVDVYLKKNKDKYRKVVVMKSNEKGYEKMEERLDVKLPTLDDFSTHLNVTRSSLFEWRDKYPKFSDSLEKILKEQKKRLLNKGISGEYNSTIAKLVLSSNHGMKERADITSDNESLVPSKEEKENVMNSIYGFINKRNSNKRKSDSEESSVSV